MKRILLAAAAAAVLTTTAFAQSTTTTVTTGAANAPLVIAPEQRAKIKSYVTTQKLAPVTVKEKIAVGATLPQDVTLVAVPSDWGPDMAKYRYVYTNNEVVLVDPSSRKVVNIIE